MAIVFAGAAISPSLALSQQLNTAQWKPSPKLNAVPTKPVAANLHDAKRPGWNLSWKTPAAAQGPVARSGQPVAPGIQQVSGTSDLTERANPVRSAGFLQPTGHHEPGVPVPVPDTNANQHGAELAPRANNFFENPFGDDRVAPPAPRHRTRQVAAQVDELFGNPADQPLDQTANPIADPARPSANGIPNSLRANPNQSGFGLPETLPEQVPSTSPGASMSGDSNPLTDPFQDDLPAPQPAERPSSPSDNIRDLLEGDSQGSVGTLPEPPGPEREDSSNLLENNPFDRDEKNAELEKLRRDLDMDRDRGEDTRNSAPNTIEPNDEEKESDQGVSCDDFRQKVSADSIRNISLDPSPPLRPDVIDQDDFDEVRAEFLEKQALRQWRAIDGTPLAVGYLRDLAYEKVIIETEYGGVEELPREELSEADLAYLTDNWGLPKQCLLEQVAYQPRRWRPMTMTWKASNLCHKPLYFEEVNLERYGHTAGPVLQPIVSSAHFFANIAVLPYKMGVHSPHECQYALGYYRPGNCAPWIIPPMPISARGAAFQTAAMVGGAWLIP